MIENLFTDFGLFLPKILFGLGFIVLTLVLYKLIIWFIKRLLKFSKIEKLNNLINENELVSTSQIKIDISNIIVGFVKFILILIILIVGADILELPIVSEQIGKLLEYFPQFITGILIFVFGVYMASQAKKLVHTMIKSFDAGGAKAISSIVFYLILVFVSITALNQIGVDTEIISNNLSYFIGASLIAVTLAVGLGSRDIVYRLILGFYTKKNLEIGMRIQIDDTVGRVISIDNICLVIQTETEKIVFPIKKINNSMVKIFNE